MFAWANKFQALMRTVTRTVTRAPHHCVPAPSYPSPTLRPSTSLHVSFGVSPWDPHHAVTTSPTTTRGQGRKKQHRVGNQWHFLTDRAGFPRSGRSVAVLFHPLLETNGSRKIDKSEVTQLLLLDIFSSNRLGEEGVTKKWHFDQTGCFHGKFSFY